MRKVLLVGNPNSGKTTLFNSLTRSNEHIGNWHGVTVENKQKSFFVGGEELVLVDTPGIYSLCPLSFEEEVATKTIIQSPDAKILNICDQNNLQRNLYLTLCLIEKGCDVVLAINEIDKKPIFKVDAKKLSQVLGIDVVLINAEKKIGIDELKKCLTTSRPADPKKLTYLGTLLSQKGGDLFQTIKFFERDERYFGEKKSFENLPKNSVQQISTLRYNFIDQVLSMCSKRTNQVYGKSKFDRFLLNKWLAFPIFVLILGLIFYLTFFSLGAFLSDILQKGLSLATTPILEFLKAKITVPWVYDLFDVAIFGGISTVLSFLPQVVLLFFFLSILEDSGYMSRIAFIFEDILGKIGLSGKSVYTLLMGFGCSTTAIMTARNMDDKNAKIKTAILCPYMSCTAKIPIYTVIGGAFFGVKNLFCIIGLYFLGVVVALIISKILDKFVLKSKSQSFILEFPPYRRSSPKRIFNILWKNVKTFLVKVGTIMVSMNIIIWVLSSFSFNFGYVAQTDSPSMLEHIGRLFTPIFKPLGFGNWAIVASLLAGLVAKEVVVSTIGMFNGIDSSATKLISKSIMLSTSVVFFSSKASVLSFLVYCLLYTPCIASISMLLQEIGKKWTLVSIVIQLFSAYVVALVVYNIAFAIEIFGFVAPTMILISILTIIFATTFIIKKIKSRSLCAHCNGCCDKKCGEKCRKK